MNSFLAADVRPSSRYPLQSGIRYHDDDDTRLVYASASGNCSDPLKRSGGGGTEAAGRSVAKRNETAHVENNCWNLKYLGFYALKLLKAAFVNCAVIGG